MTTDNTTDNAELGEPDFSHLMEDDQVEITAADIPGEQAAGGNGLKAGEMITMIIGMGFNFVASRKGEHWKLAPEEAQELATVTNQAMDEYFPEFEASPGWMLAAVSCGIVAPRLIVDAQNAAKEAEERAEVEPTSEQ